MAFKNIGELNTMANNPVADTRHSIPMPIHRHSHFGSISASTNRFEVAKIQPKAQRPLTAVRVFFIYALIHLS